jgi:HK97 family phage major capsid protein
MTISKLAALAAVSAIALTRDREAPPEQLTRELAFEVRAGSVDDRNRTVQLTFSSEEPYQRWWGTEVLDHAEASVRLGRLNNGGALLMDHDSRDQVGVVERAWIEGRKAYAVVRFGKSARAQEVYEDVKDGIRKLVSVGYRILELALEKSSDGQETYRATDWEPYEISLVAVPADPSVGVGRDGKPEGFDPRTLLEKENDMRLARNASGTPAPAQNVPAADAQLDARAERARVLDLQEMARRFSIDQATVDQAINEGWTRDQLAQRLPSNRPAVAIRTGEEIDRRDDFNRARDQFSLVNAIRDMVEGGKLTGREAEVSQELARMNGGRAPQGIYVPTGILAERTQLVGTPSVGGNLVGQEYRDQDFITPLRRRSVIMQSGATVLTDLVGNAVLPRQTNATAGQWIAEDAEATETDLTFDQVTLTPKTVSGRISWSRQAALQALPAMENIVRGDLSEQLGLALDAAAIAGTAASNQPRGILNTAGIGAVPIGTNGGAPTFDHIVALETAVAAANADAGTMAYLTNSAMRGRLKRTTQFGSGTDAPIWSPDNRVNGYAALMSNNVPSDLTKGSGTNLSAMIFGNWQHLLIGLWGALDLIVDPYTFSSRGRIRISAFLSADISVRRAASFAAIVDAITT